MKTKKVNFRQDIASIDSSLYNPRFLEKLTAMLYQENSKFSKFSITKQGEDIGKFSIPYILERSSQPHKAYPSKKVYSFEDYKDASTKPMDLYDAIQRRRSGRDYSNYPISLSELYQVLHFSYGITGEAPIQGVEGTWSYRAVPSGGALYPLEIYLYINQSSLPRGIYHYRPDKPGIELIDENDHMDKLRKILVAEPYVNLPKSSCVVFISSVFERTLLKYGERGFRFILQEVGFVSQNISLICEALGLSSCMIGSYIDDQVNKLLQADGCLESIQNVIIIGKENQKEKEEKCQVLQ